jgi:hypothetical protein
VTTETEITETPGSESSKILFLNLSSNVRHYPALLTPRDARGARTGENPHPEGWYPLTLNQRLFARPRDKFSLEAPFRTVVMSLLFSREMLSGKDLQNCSRSVLHVPHHVDLHVNIRTRKNKKTTLYAIES